MFATLIETHVRPDESSSDSSSDSDNDGKEDDKEPEQQQQQQQGGGGGIGVPLKEGYTPLKDSTSGTKGKEKLKGSTSGAGGGKDKTTPQKQEEEKKKENKIMTVEERDVGSVSWDVYWQYIAAVGGVLVGGSILLLFALDQGTQLTNSWFEIYAHTCPHVIHTIVNNDDNTKRWLSYWSDQDADGSETYKYLGIYAALGFAALVFVLIRTFLFAYGTLTSARVLHERLIATVNNKTVCR